MVGNGLRELDGTDLVIYVNDGIVTRARHRAPFAGVGASTWCWNDEAAAIKLGFEFGGLAFKTVDGASRGFVKVESLDSCLACTKEATVGDAPPTRNRLRMQPRAHLSKSRGRMTKHSTFVMSHPRCSV